MSAVKKNKMQGKRSEKTGQTRWAPRPRYSPYFIILFKDQHGKWSQYCSCMGHWWSHLRLLGPLGSWRLRCHLLCQEAPMKTASGLRKCVTPSLPKSLASTKLQQIVSAFRIKEGRSFVIYCKACLDFPSGPLLLVINTTDYKWNNQTAVSCTYKDHSQIWL